MYLSAYHDFIYSFFRLIPNSWETSPSFSQRKQNCFVGSSCPVRPSFTCLGSPSPQQHLPSFPSAILPGSTTCLHGPSSLQLLFTLTEVGWQLKETVLPSLSTPLPLAVAGQNFPVLNILQRHHTRFSCWLKFVMESVNWERKFPAA